MSNIFSGARFKASLRAFLFGRIAQAGFSFALILATVVFLRPDDYGMYMLIWGFIEFAAPLTSIGLLPAVQRFLPELAEHGTKSGLFKFVRVFKLARYAVVTVFTTLLYWLWRDVERLMGYASRDDLRAEICLLLLAVVLGRFAAEMLECLLEQAKAQLVRALFPIIRTVGLGLFWWAGRRSIEDVIVLDLAAALFVWLLAEGFFVHQLRRHAPTGTAQPDFGKVWLFVRDMSLVQVVAAMSNAGAIRLAAGSVLGLAQLGQFAFLQQLTINIQRYLPSILLANLVRPMLISAHAGGRDHEAGAAVSVLWKVNLLLTLPALIVLGGAGDALLGLASSGRVPDGAVPMGLLVVGLMAQSQEQIMSMALQVLGRANLVRLLAMWSLLIPLAAHFGARWGMSTMAACVAVVAWMRAAAAMRTLRRQMPSFTTEHRRVYKFAALAVALTLVGAIANRVLPVAGMVSSMIFAAVFLAMVLHVGLLDRKEADYLSTLFGRKSKFIRWLSGRRGLINEP